MRSAGKAPGASYAMSEQAACLRSLEDNLSFRGLFELQRKHGQRIAFVSEDASGVPVHISYAEFREQVSRAAAALRARWPTQRGQFVGLHLDNQTSWPVLFWGLLMAGFRPLLLDFRASDETFLDSLRRAQVQVCITDRKAALSADVELITPHLALQLDEESAALQFSDAQWEDHIALCTSGTGAASRMVVFSGRSFVANVFAGWQVATDSPYLGRSGGTLLAFVPFFHVLGLLTLSWYTAMGMTLVFLPDRAPQTISRTALRHGVNLIYGVPLLWNALAARIRSQVAARSRLERGVFTVLCALSWVAQALFGVAGQRFAQRVLFGKLHARLLGTETCLVSTGAHLPLATVKTLTSIGFPLLSGWGMTEACTITIDVGKRLWPRLSGSVGVPLSGAEVRVGQGNNPGAVGELFVRSRALFDYELIDGVLVPQQRVDGWMATGDLGRFQAGSLRIVGRSKDTIIPATGENVQPEEVEDALGSLVGVESWAVLGLRSKTAGESVGLVAYLGAGPLQDAQCDQLAAQVDRANQRLPIAKRVTRVLVSTTSLPTTTSMKVKRQQLKATIEQGGAAFRELSIASNSVAASIQPEATDMQSTIEEVRGMVAQVLELERGKIRDEAHLIYDLGADSLKLLELRSRIERRWDISNSEELFREALTVGAVSRIVVQVVRGTYVSKVTASAPVEAITRIDQDPDYKAWHARMQSAGDFNPYFVEHDSVVKDTSRVNGRQVINLASYNYLGLSGHSVVVEAAQRAAAQYGTSASGSRLLTGEKPLYRQLEAALADWKGVEAALILVSGHATNVTFVGNFCTKSDLILYDALSHNSVEQGCRLSSAVSRPFLHNDPDDLERILRQTRSQYRKVLVAIEGVYSMEGDIAPVPEFVALKRKYGCFLLVDEAHSAGVIGKTGKGVDELFGLGPDDIDVRMGTLSKALGACGGYLAGRRSLVEYMRYSLPGFVFSVGISPPNAGAALAALQVLQREPERVSRLRSNVDCFVSEASRLSLTVLGGGASPIVPIVVGDELRAFELCSLLRAQGIFVAPAVYPSVPRGRARLRFCVTSEHSPAQIRQALQTLARLLKGAHSDSVSPTAHPMPANVSPVL